MDEFERRFIERTPNERFTAPNARRVRLRLVRRDGASAVKPFPTPPQRCQRLAG